MNRLAVDIGGTFTDVVLEAGDRQYTRKVLTTPAAPEKAVIQGVLDIMPESGLTPDRIDLVIHGTTLATNAVIERKGARTALIVTEGFRDAVEMAYENRFEQYDIDVERPKPLVPRYLRWPVHERITATGTVLVPLDEASVEALLPQIDTYEIESIAIGLMHGYARPDHERRIAEIIRAARPAVTLTLASEVCPEIREYERLSTASANAYVQPLMARYLRNLDTDLRANGFDCPLLLMMSSGGLTTLDTAIRFPIRLVDSGPAGGAILAGQIAAESGLAETLSFDMGGTTAKICLIDGAKPQTARSFEIDRAYRFTKGSGLPLRIPVIELVEIGAGGGSIASVDGLDRIAVGPESAGADPGPACYDKGGTRPTVSDADLVLGRIDPAAFAGGAVTLAADAAAEAVRRDVGARLKLDPPLAAFAVCEMVDENMANAARVHAIELGKDVSRRALVAFGGAAPLHAARMAEKLGIDTVVVPTGAGVGSAIGFLRAPVSFEIVLTRYMRLAALAVDALDKLFQEMRANAEAVVRQAAPDGVFIETRQGYMRYVGQGHEVAVRLPNGRLTAATVDEIQTAFAATYTGLYGRTIPGVDVEVLSWSLSLSTEPATPAAIPEPESVTAPASGVTRSVFEAGSTGFAPHPVYDRGDLAPGEVIAGPALIVEDQTTTVVSASFDARIDGRYYIVMTRKPAG